VLGDELQYSVLEGICKLIIVREVLPYSTPLKLIKTFADFCKICIFPFLMFLGPEDESRMSEMSSRSFDDEFSQTQSILNLEANQRQVELWGRAPGLLNSDFTHIQFLD
jgi:hypothetical protein